MMDMVSSLVSGVGCGFRRRRTAAALGGIGEKVQRAGETVARGGMDVACFWAFPGAKRRLERAPGRLAGARRRRHALQRAACRAGEEDKRGNGLGWLAGPRGDELGRMAK